MGSVRRQDFWCVDDSYFSLRSFSQRFEFLSPQRHLPPSEHDDSY